MCFCNGSGSLARVTPLSPAATGFLCFVLLFQYVAMHHFAGWLARSRQTNHLSNAFWSAGYRGTRGATGEDQVAEMEAEVPPTVTFTFDSLFRVYIRTSPPSPGVQAKVIN